MSERDDAGYIEHLEALVAKLEAQVKTLQEEVGRVKKEKGLSSAREGLTFNDRFGIWTDASGRHFCPKCLDKEKRNPLKTEERGWRCTTCSGWFANPDKPLPSVIRSRPGGGNDWMGS